MSNLGDRAAYLGASDMPDLFGLGYGSSYQKYLEKTRRLPPVEQTEEMRRGNALEPLVMALYEHRTGYKVYPYDQGREDNPSEAVDPEYPFLRCHPDGKGPHRLVQAKTHSKWLMKEYGEEGTDELPGGEIMQVTMEMGLAHYSVCDVPVLWIHSEREAKMLEMIWHPERGNQSLWPMSKIADLCDFKIYTVPFNESLWHDIRTRAAEWWQKHIVGDEAPEPTGDDIPAIRRAWPSDTGEVIVATDEQNESVKNFLEWKEKLDDAKKKTEGFQAQVLAAFGDATFLQTADYGRAKYAQNKPSQKTDWEKLATFLLDKYVGKSNMVQQYTTTEPGNRVLRPRKEWK